MPHIYSFVTNTLPNYLKVGDTYRTVEERLNEWRRHYRDLEEISRHKATINDEVFFRDYSVHKYLQQKGITQIPLDVSKNIHTNEFFEGVGESDVSEAVNDIVKNYKKSDTYEYYNNVKDRYEYHYERTQDFIPRKNQQEVINAFQAAIKDGRDNLLMYAVMRFGKSITSMWSAKSIDSKLTVIVSAKADVRSEWKETVESHKDFTGYRFIDKSDLKKGLRLVDLYGKRFKTGSSEEVCTNIVLFLTLQDLAGSTETIKNHHKILKDASVDLLIIDETHFGARAQVLGKILAGVKLDEEEKNALKNDKEDSEKLGSLEKLEAIKAGKKLHLSGTPYRILMGSEFEQEDIIAFVQFSDIYEAKLQWSVEHLDENEWDNPYYGFPQMIRFAFNPNESSRKKLADISGSKPAELFTPVSTKKSGNYKAFVHEQEVIDLLQVLDGTKSDSNMLGLLDNETVKAGKLTQHIVIVLPFRASCDALEKLITKNKKSFKNIAEYKLFNISGFDQTLSTPEEIKSAISKAESAGKKTITLTVNKMLTGATVPQWDTMIYLKGTASPQEYDQAIFRLQSPWIQKYQDNGGKIIKYDMKPQTLLVDLDPTRLFYLQEMKAFTYGANTQNVGNEHLETFIERELKISPIIALNAEGNKLVEVNATTIIDEVRKYANDRTIAEDVREIGIDLSLKDNQAIFGVINKLAELGGKNGLNIKPNQEEGEELDGIEPEDDSDMPIDASKSTGADDADSSEDISSFEKRFRTYYVMILLFAFLSSTEEESLTDVIDNIGANDDNQRIARNLGLNKEDLVLIREHINPFVRSALDYKIQNTDFRASDATLSATEHVDVAIHKFGRLSDAEVFTPSSTVNQVYDAFDEDFWCSVKGARILDIASKSGSFAKGFVEKATKYGVNTENLKDNFFSIPTSPAAYEFTRKMYEALGLNVDNIAKYFNSFDLIKLNEDEVQYLLSQDKRFSEIALKDLESYTNSEKNTHKGMKFSAIVGNPPYQENTGNSRDKPIYPYFMDQAYRLSDLVSLITPARFLFNAGQTNKIWNKKMLQDKHLKVERFIQKSSDIFPNTDIKGGVVITLHNANKVLGPIDTFTSFAELNTILHKVLSREFQSVSSIIFGNSTYKFTEKLYVDYPKLKSRSKPSERRSIGTNIFEKLPEIFSDAQPKAGDGEYIRIYGREGDRRTFKWVRREYIADHPNLRKWKIFVPKSNGTGAIGEVLSTPLIGEPLIGANQTFISFGAFGARSEAQNCMKFIKTKFARVLLGTLKITQHNSKPAWENVPLQDFTKKSDIDWTKSVADIDKQLYKKYGLSKHEINFIEAHVKAMP